MGRQAAHSELWLWIGGALIAVGCVLFAVSGGFAAARHHFSLWTSPEAVASYVCGALALVCLFMATKGYPFPPWRQTTVAAPIQPGSRSGFSDAEISALEERRIEQKVRDGQKRIVDDQVWLAQHDIRSHVWPIGQANNMELARMVDEWITSTKAVLKNAIGESEALFFSVDVGDPGIVVGSPGATELEVMKAIQTRHLERLDRHIIRLQKIKDRL